MLTERQRKALGGYLPKLYDAAAVVPVPAITQYVGFALLNRPGF